MDPVSMTTLSVCDILRRERHAPMDFRVCVARDIRGFRRVWADRLGPCGHGFDSTAPVAYVSATSWR